jgi:glutamine synthetase
MHIHISMLNNKGENVLADAMAKIPRCSNARWPG